MAQMRCPGCGAPYNGKKCRMCLYEPMDTDLSRRAEKSAPVPKKKASQPKQKKRESVFSSLGGFLIILALVAITMPSIQNWGVKLEAIEAANLAPEPIPGNPTVLFQQESITVLVPETDSPSISLWFYNQGKEDAMVTCRDITLNGYRMEWAECSVYVPAGSAVKSTLLELETQADTFAFSMEAQKPNGEFLFETAPIHLKERTAAYN